MPSARRTSDFSGAVGVADGDGAMADRAEIEWPAVLLREAAHVRGGGIDEVIDEADALGEAQHAISEAIAEMARHLGHIAQLDQRLEEPHDGWARQARFRQPVRRRVPCGRRLSASRTVKLRRTGSIMLATRLFRITDSVDLAAEMPCGSE